MTRSARGLFVLLVALCAAPGCRPERPRQGTSGEASMAYLGVARALHHEADVYESSGNYTHAAQAMERVLTLPMPADFAARDDLRADAWGRLAELDLRRDDADRALARCDEGLRATTRESVLLARLYMVRGQALRALADRAAAAHDDSGAARMRDEAIAALERSIAINQRVLGRIITPGGRR